MRIHKSVLLGEAIEALEIKEGNVVVDATLGSGGHSQEILQRIRKTGKLIAIDQDQEAVDDFRKSKGDDLRVSLVKDNFSNLDLILADLKINSVDAILADLGFSSDQMESAERGMSFQKEAPLDMRLDQTSELTAEKHPRFMNEKVESVKQFYDGILEEEVLRKVGEQEFNYGVEYDALARFEGTHPVVMKERIKRLNWNVDVDLKKTNLKFKHRILYKIEKWFGVRLFEYRNYKILKNRN